MPTWGWPLVPDGLWLAGHTQHISHRTSSGHTQHTGDRTQDILRLAQGMQHRKAAALAASALTSALALRYAKRCSWIHALGSGRLFSLVSVRPRTWAETLQDVLPAIVVIRVSAVRAFDGEDAGYSWATGFVVDKAKGIILSNRHVVTPGPIVADAVFANKEEIPLRPIYRDPVHDFGFFSFNPTDIQFMNLAEIPLDPEGARVGTEIRVVGNDDGEKFSILSATLARIDRAAPHYGNDTYNDFNTFYLGAASNTSGGSSGSPVLTKDGVAVGLNAGSSNQAASAYYLPLHRVKRALECIQENFHLLERSSSKEDLSPEVDSFHPSVVVPRGTLRAVFLYRPFDEIDRYGLQLATQQAVREALPAESGMLVVEQVIPGAVGQFLEPGDVLVRLRGELCTSFVQLEKVLDDNVGSTVQIEVERGGVAHKLQLCVEDLHSLMVSRYLEVSGGVVHAISYNAARNFNVNPGGAYIACGGFMFSKAGLSKGCVIIEVGGQKIEGVEDLATVLSRYHNGDVVLVRYFVLGYNSRMLTTSLKLEFNWWCPMQMSERNDTLGLWMPRVYRMSHPLLTSPPPIACPFALTGNKLSDLLQASLVEVRFHVAYSLDGINAVDFMGSGLVVDAERGLVLVDQQTVPLSSGSVCMVVASTLEVPMKVVFVHPVHNFTILSYDPSRVRGTPLKTVRLSNTPLKSGDACNFIGLSDRGQLISQLCVVKELRAFNHDELPDVPRYLAYNVDVLHFESKPQNTVGGVFVDAEGAVQALFASFCYTYNEHTEETFCGLPVDVVRDCIAQIREGVDPLWINSLEVNLTTVSLSQARQTMQLADRWIEEVRRRHPSRLQVLSIKSVAPNTPAADALCVGDLIVAVDQDHVSTFRELEAKVEEANKHHSSEGILSGAQRDLIEPAEAMLQSERPFPSCSEITLTVIRNKQEVQVPVRAVRLNGLGTRRFVIWCGLLLQQHHRSVVRQHCFEPSSGGCYISRYFFGSPAHKYGLVPRMWLVELNGKKTPNLQVLVDLVRSMQKEGKHDKLRVKLVSLSGQEKCLTLRADNHYWPLWDFRSVGEHWEREQIQQL